MPGILGLTNPNKASELPLMEDALFKSPYAHYQNCDNISEAWGVVSLKQEKASIEYKGVKIAFEGYVLNNLKIGNELLMWLAELFLENGPEFARELRGSFQIVIKYGGRTYLYVDPTASRPLFFMKENAVLYFSPEIAPLMVQKEKADCDQANLVQFLVAGHFFSGSTLARQIKNLRPGEFLVIEKGSIKLKQYYTYEMTSADSFDKKEAIDRLNRNLQEAIISHWERAENPGILLSGGIDSRYIFYTIADYVSDTSKLKTICWSEDLKKKRSDAEISNKIAKHFGTEHILIKRKTQNFESAFRNMFYAQSGMTDSTFIHADELEICRRLREDHNIFSLFRGDHAFGGSPERTTVQQGLLDLGMSLTEQIANKDMWFNERAKMFLSSHNDAINNLISQYTCDPNGMRETLRFRERIPIYLHQLNYFKYHYQEVYNPFLEKSVLQLSKNIPSQYRANKKLLKECYRRKFKRYPDIPFAHYPGTVNWKRAIARSPLLSSFLYKNISQLPNFFNKEYFLNCLSSINYHFGSQSIQWAKHLTKRIARNLPLPKSYLEALRGTKPQLPTSLIIPRLVVLSSWFKLWIKSCE